MYPKILTVLALFVIQFSVIAQNTPSFLPTNGLVGWWPFTGNAFDSSMNGNNGVVSGATLTNDRFGNANAAYSFNGLNSRIEILDAASLRCKKITLSAWVFNNNIIKIGQIIYKGSLVANGEAYSLSSVDQRINTGVKIGSNCVANVGWKGVQGKQPMVQGAWEHYVATYDGNIYRIYRNGILDTSKAIAGLMDECVGGNLRFGFDHTLYSNSTGDGFDGVIDDIGIWNRALDQMEITQLYTSVYACGEGNVGVNICEPQRNLHVKDVMRLEPRNTSPSNPGKGDIYFDGITNKLRVYNGTEWKDCW